MPSEDHDADSGGSQFLSELFQGVSVPLAVLRSLYKASDRLCSALVDVPVAYLEGVSEERRAQTEVRVSLVRTTAGKIAEQMRVDPDYARRAVTRFGQKVLREQVNLDTIVLNAAELVRTENRDSQETQVEEGTDTQSISDDWLNTFDSEGRTKSTEEMQTYFSRVLAGEITRPNSYSVRSLRILGNLDQNSARAFELLCSMSSCLEHSKLSNMDSRVLSLGGNAAHNSLAGFGLNFDTLNLLNEYGLIISDYNSWQDYQLCISRSIPALHELPTRLAFKHQGTHWVLIPQTGFRQQTEFRLHGVALTNSGRELQRVVGGRPSLAYTERLKRYFLEKKLLMAQYPNSEFHTIQSDERTNPH